MGFLFNTNSISPISSGGGSGGDAVWGGISGTLSNQIDLQNALNAKQNTLISGTNIKTINDNSILGNGNLEINASVNTDNITINKNFSNELQAIGIQNARTDTAIRLWIGNQTQYNNGGSQIYYNWQSGGVNRFDSGVSFEPKSIAYGNGKYIIISSSGIKSSTDKVNWVDETSGVNVTLNSIAYGNGKFVVVGNSGTIISSSGDGTWTTETSGTSNNITSICFGNNLFVTGGVGLYSSGDETWTANNKSFNKVIFAGGYFYGISGRWRDVEDVGYAEAYVYKSSDAIVWNSVVNKVKVSNSGPNLKIIGANNYIYMGYRTSNYNWYYAYTADSGTTWTDVNDIPEDILYNNGTYYKITSAYLQTSTDGTNYTNVGSAVFIQYITYGDALVGVGYNSMESYNFYEIIYSESLSVYTTDENPTTESIVYSAPSTVSALTITSVGTGTITCSDTNTYTYNSAGNQTVTQNVGQAHPNYICLIEGVGIMMNNVSFIPTVDQTYNASSTNAQSGVAVASGISDTLGTINTQLESIIAQGD